jgi:hypothetical protein
VVGLWVFRLSGPEWQSEAGYSGSISSLFIQLASQQVDSWISLFPALTSVPYAGAMYAPYF